jgi:hypothetical protein
MTTRVAGLSTVATQSGQRMHELVSFWRTDLARLQRANRIAKQEGWLIAEDIARRIIQRARFMRFEADVAYWQYVASRNTQA